MCAGAYDGDQAIEIYTLPGHDLVLLHDSMPGKIGYEVMEFIFQQDQDALVIIMTGYASVTSSAMVLKIGAWDF